MQVEKLDFYFKNATHFSSYLLGRLRGRHQTDFGFRKQEAHEFFTKLCIKLQDKE